MTTPTPEELLDTLMFRVNNPDTQALLTQLSADIVRTAALTLTDPAAAEREAAILKASLSNISATEQIAIQSAVTDWLTRVVVSLVTAAFD